MKDEYMKHSRIGQRRTGGNGRLSKIATEGLGGLRGKAGPFGELDPLSALGRVGVLGLCGMLSLLSPFAWGQKTPRFPITPEQTATAQRVSQAGVALEDLAPDAPERYVVKAGDTLWAISQLYLRQPWRWPELWGMNLQDIRNPHLIFPGQTLYLDKRDGRARLSTVAPGGNGTEGDLQTVRLSPRVRSEPALNPLSTLQTRAIEPFLAEPLIVEEGELMLAPRIVAAGEGRVIMGRGDRVYARGPDGAPMLDDEASRTPYRVFRNPKALKDPDTGELLAYEAEYLGKASLVRGEGTTEVATGRDELSTAVVPATIDIIAVKSEMLVGDRLVPEPPREFLSFSPHAPIQPLSGRIVSIYSNNAVVNASQNQVVVINRGQRDGLERGHVLAILKDGAQLEDRTDPARTLMKLPNERNGLLMVFRTYEKLSYALILEIKDPVRVGDRLNTPR